MVAVLSHPLARGLDLIGVRVTIPDIISRHGHVTPDTQCGD